MSSFYIPPPEISVRILTYSGQHVLTKGETESNSRHGSFARVAQVSATANGDDQYWTLEGNANTTRMIRNKSSKKVMYLDSPEKSIPIFLTESRPGNGPAQSYITLEPGKGNHEGYFRLIMTTSNGGRIIVSESAGLKIDEVDPAKVDAYPVSSSSIHIEYNFKESKRFNERPHVLVDTCLANETESEQTLTYEPNEKTSTTSKWDYKAGFKLGVSKKVKSREIRRVDFSVSFEWSEGKSYTTEQAWKASFPVKAKAGERVRAKSSVWMGNVEVPYSLVMKNRDGHRVEKKGIWHGVLAWNLRHELKTETVEGKEVKTVTL